MTLTEGGTTQSQPVQCISMSTSVADPVIRTGTSTTAKVRITGLSDMKVETLSGALVNQDPSVVSLEGKQVQPFEVKKTEVPLSGLIERQFNVRAHNPGQYRLTLQFPSAIESGRTDEEPEPYFGVKLDLSNRGDAYTLVVTSANRENPMSVVAATARMEPSGPMLSLLKPTETTGGPQRIVWDTKGLPRGTYTVQVQAAGGQGQTSTERQRVNLGGRSDLPQFANRVFQANFTRSFQANPTISRDQIDNVRRQADQMDESEDDLRERAWQKEQEAARERQAAQDATRKANRLIEIDKKLEAARDEAGPELKEDAKKLDDLKKGAAPNPAAVDQALADAKKACDDCDENCQKEKDELKKLEDALAALNAQGQAIAQAVNALFAGQRRQLDRKRPVQSRRIRAVGFCHRHVGWKPRRLGLGGQPSLQQSAASGPPAQKGHQSGQSGNSGSKGEDRRMRGQMQRAGGGAQEGRRSQGQCGCTASGSSSRGKRAPTGPGGDRWRASADWTTISTTMRRRIRNSPS